MLFFFKVINLYMDFYEHVKYLGYINMKNYLQLKFRIIDLNIFLTSL
jgi:hypothetical protein